MATAAPEKTKDQEGADTGNGNGEDAASEVMDIETILGNTREQFVAKMEEFRPAHEAFVKLESIVDNFDRITSGEPVRVARRGTSAVAGERAGRGSRPAEFLSVIREAGPEGITVADAAAKMDGMNPNYLYRIAGNLTKDGAIRKGDDKKYVAV